MRHAQQRLAESSQSYFSRRAPRAGEVDAKVIILIVVAGIGGFALLGCAVMTALLLPAAQKARDAARMTQSKNNLKQIGLALHNYHDAYSVFPPGGVYAEDGTPHHSWQTMLLPYVDQAALYNVIDFNRPWTDPYNAGHFSTIVPTYLNPAEPQITPAAGGAVSHYAGNNHVLFENSSVTIRNVTDGTSNTMLAGEVAAGYKAWGDPSNVRDPAGGILRDANTFGSPSDPNGCIILMMDGSTRHISSNVNPVVFKALATPFGGEATPKF